LGFGFPYEKTPFCQVTWAEVVTICPFEPHVSENYSYSSSHNHGSVENGMSSRLVFIGNRGHVPDYLWYEKKIAIFLLGP